jgi:uncharacterized RDD family membrane protein YckC
LLAILLDTLIWIAYHTITEFFFAGTPGKHLMGIAVQSQQYTRCTLRQSLVRNVIRPFDAIGFYALGFIVAVSTKRHLRIGDLCAKTVVTEQTDSERLRALAVFVLCLICSFALAFAFTHFAGSK